MRTLVLLSLLAACGGKIAPDPNAGPAPEPASTDSPQSVSATPSIEAACETVCERNSRCGAGYKPDCLSKCLTDATGGCASASIAFTTCWARTIHEGCDELAPECEPRYCAYTACMGIVQPPYCR